ncbi:hypothetical protein [Herbiconiux sp.]|uniref:hypothetical protein n=1 Tax=Herbiconiux sp. TaxID=1871186 RepID=UPI0025BCCE8F|nr:hypothetical protein [Herbiconiux sp.]
MTPERSADAFVAQGRLAKAEEFEAAAELFFEGDGAGDHRDAYVTLAVHAGIAAADVICIRRLARYSPTGTHAETVALLEKAQSGAGRHLERLLALKSKAGYAHRPVSASDVLVARRCSAALVEIARTMRG